LLNESDAHYDMINLHQSCTWSLKACCGRVQVLLRGSFDWHSCLQLVDLVVNASAPCAVGQLQPHKPLCRLGAAQPTLEGTFLAMTGKQ